MLEVKDTLPPVPVAVAVVRVQITDQPTELTTQTTKITQMVELASQPQQQCRALTVLVVAVAVADYWADPAVYYSKQQMVSLVAMEVMQDQTQWEGARLPLVNMSQLTLLEKWLFAISHG
jgi:hypothetical protein